MSDSITEDLLVYLDELGIVERGVDAFTEADLNGYHERPACAIITMSTPPQEPSGTADVDYHRITFAVVSGMGEKGLTATNSMAMAIYRGFRPGPMRAVLDETICGTLYKCIRPVTPPYQVNWDEETKRVQYNIDLEVTRYIGEEAWA